MPLLAGGDGRAAAIDDKGDGGYRQASIGFNGRYSLSVSVLIASRKGSIGDLLYIIDRIVSRSLGDSVGYHPGLDSSRLSLSVGILGVVGVSYAKMSYVLPPAGSLIPVQNVISSYGSENHVSYIIQVCNRRHY
ncbi:hypothetical protein ES708_32378 [subsurface metagenome]